MLAEVPELNSDDITSLVLLVLYEKFYRPLAGKAGFWDAYFTSQPDSYTIPHVRIFRLTSWLLHQPSLRNFANFANFTNFPDEMHTSRRVNKLICLLFCGIGESFHSSNEIALGLA